MTDRADVLALVDELIEVVDQRMVALKEGEVHALVAKYFEIRNRDLAVIAVKAGGYPAVRADYKRTLDDVLSSFGTSDQGVKVTAAQNELTRAMVEAFQSAFDLGYTETSGDEEQADKDAQDWLNSRVESEMGYIKEMFQSLKDLRAQLWAGDIKSADVRDFVAMRVEGYTSSLDAVNNAGRMWGNKNQMLTWRLGKTEKHCKSCLSLDGQSHRAKWYLAYDYIPRKPYAAMDCGGFNCDCSVLDQEGNPVTL